MAKGPGRPSQGFNFETFDALMQFRATTKEFAADYMGCSISTIDNQLKKEKNTTFQIYHEMKMGRVSNKLQEKAIQMALAGDRTMLIFCLKNYAKWQDKVEVDVTHKVSNFAEWAQGAAEAYEKRKKQKAIKSTEARRKKFKDVN